eukprot:750480-Hanusia_phi.AAC.16
MVYMFETVQPVRFYLYDVDSPDAALIHADGLGYIETTMGRVVGSVGSCFVGSLKDPNGKNSNCGSIKVLAEESSTQTDSLRFIISESGLKIKDWVGKGDHYIKIRRQRQDRELEDVSETEELKDSKDPTFKPIEIPMHMLNLGKLDTPLVFEVWDWNSRSKDNFSGQVTSTAVELLRQSGPITFPVTSKEKANDGKDRGSLNSLTSGSLDCQDPLHHTPSFVEFVSGGCRLEILEAIDFTLSNGSPNCPNSLHYNDSNGSLNQYQTAVSSVGKILEEYSTSKTFGAYGFGAQMADGDVSFCFPLNGNKAKPTVNGVEGVLQAYKQFLENAVMSGPTNFADIIHEANQACRKIRHGVQQYYVLVILTDGGISDMDNTIHEIVEGSDLPLSIVIVGVGREDFSSMEELDADKKALVSMKTNKASSRDIVQFVAMREVGSNGGELARRVLAEIPDQLTRYMISKNIQPNSRQTADIEQTQRNLKGLNLNAPPPSYMPPGWEERLDQGTGKPY